MSNNVCLSCAEKITTTVHLCKNKATLPAVNFQCSECKYLREENNNIRESLNEISKKYVQYFEECEKLKNKLDIAKEALTQQTKPIGNAINSMNDTLSILTTNWKISKQALDEIERIGK